jgi:hypothetical protein
MKRFLAFAFVGAMLSTTALCDDNKEFKNFMLSFIPKIEQAFKKLDMKFFEDISTADFTEVMEGKTNTKAEAMAQMKAQMKTVQSCKAKFKLLTSKADKGEGVATTSGDFVMVSKPAKKGDKPHTMSMLGMVEKETWVKVGKTWKIKKLEQVKMGKMLMDGKPMGAPPMPPKKGG